jgi:hypothetical protein
VSRPFLRRERLEDHVISVIAGGAGSRAIRRRHYIGASNGLQLRDQDLYGLQGLLAKTSLGGQLMRSDHTLVDLIE